MSIKQAFHLVVLDIARCLGWAYHHVCQDDPWMNKAAALACNVKATFIMVYACMLLVASLMVVTSSAATLDIVHDSAFFVLGAIVLALLACAYRSVAKSLSKKVAS